jgi:hypothetical protein
MSLHLSAILRREDEDVDLRPSILNFDGGDDLNPWDRKLNGPHTRTGGVDDSGDKIPAMLGL